MFAVIKKDSRIEGKDEERQVIVERVTVRTLADVEKNGVQFARAKHGDVIRVVTVDGQKLDFNSSGKLVAGGTEEKEAPKPAAAAEEKKDEKKAS